MARELEIEEIEIEREVLNIHPHRWIRFYGWQRLKIYCVVTVVLLEVNATVQLNRCDTFREASFGVAAHTCAVAAFSSFSSDLLTQ
ncbi:hypothetical protein F2Q70_00042557 [Brassica cretica]|uniref:Uncharacterized protein n=1 Tax=Brassica cretica TaxID=69181 RepID=A0A8S9KNE9_BRACR|nr:hypothetical protein F2Q70_00042557 [Brassica cretica]